MYKIHVYLYISTCTCKEENECLSFDVGIMGSHSTLSKAGDEALEDDGVRALYAHGAALLTPRVLFARRCVSTELDNAEPPLLPSLPSHKAQIETQASPDHPLTPAPYQPGEFPNYALCVDDGQPS